jgi:bifunctional enzyme CysN/CysC
VALGKDKDLLRFLAVGSVDDGKSTLIGRLLYDSGALPEDHLAPLRRASARRNEAIDFSLITDGLRAEREQAITLDVAYRYFSTQRRKFVVADVPGHDQYTRNMITGASNADLAVVLLDARKGMLEQTRRHIYICWLFGIRRIVAAVNKMDMVDFEREAFEAIQSQLAQFAQALPGTQQHLIPTSALLGENIVRRADRMPWYRGPSLLDLLESIPVEDGRNLSDFRFPVQSVIRPHQDFRAYAGQIASGIVRPGQEVAALPSGRRTRVEQVLLSDQSLDAAFAPQSVALSLADHLDVGRGDMLADPARMPSITRKLKAHLIWMSRSPLRLDSPFLLKHTTSTVCASVTRLHHRIDILDGRPSPAESLELNEIGMAEIETHRPLFCDPYLDNRATGSFILIDPLSNNTVAAGMILEAKPESGAGRAPADAVQAVAAAGKGKGLTVWFTGLSGAGKSTICRSVETELLARGFRVEVLDGDALRKQLNSDLGFSKEDRDENIRRIGFVARLLSRNGVVVLVAAISPYRAIREEVRGSIGDFIEVHVNAPLGVCESRDPKGLYKKARAGEIRRFTGIDDPYEPPLAPEVRCDTDRESLKECAGKVVAAVVASLGPSGV